MPRKLGRTVHLTTEDAHLTVQLRRRLLTVEEILGSGMRDHPLYLEPQRLTKELREEYEKQRHELLERLGAND